MTYASFFRSLAVALLVAAGGASLAHLLLPLAYAVPFTILTLVLFLLVTLAIFYFGERTADAENKHLFGNVFMASTLVKMLLCGMLVVMYVILARPESKLFIVPFFWLYFVFTGFEVWFLLRLARRA